MFPVKNRKALLNTVALSAGALASGVSHAAVDVSAVVTEISSNSASVAAIGGAALTVYVAARAFGWLRIAAR